MFGQRKLLLFRGNPCSGSGYFVTPLAAWRLDVLANPVERPCLDPRGAEQE